MVNLLIDNCSLRDLIDTQGYSKFLSRLENHIQNNELQLYAHQLLLQEWNKHKSRWKKDKEQKLLGNGKNISELNPTAAIKTFTNSQHILEQIKKIDELLNNSIILETPDVIKADFSDRYRNRLAPFHIKQNSQNDWEIIGSFCNHCQHKGIKELFFLSANKTDFSNLNMENLQIHDDITTRFPKVIVRYFADFINLFNCIESINGLPVELITYTMLSNSEYTYKATYKKNILDSLIYIFTDLYTEVDVIPIHILKKLHPFASSENEHAYYDRFTMHYVSEEMFAFFQNIKISTNGDISYIEEKLFSKIKDYDEKIKIVLIHLTKNCVFNISSKKQNRTIPVFYVRHSICDCIRCSFNKLDFKLILPNLMPQKDLELKELLKYAYINVHVGNFKLANDIYETICELILSKKKSKRIWITYFISKYNQKHLSKFLSNYFGNYKLDNKLIEKLKKIDPFEEAVKLKPHTDYNLLNFIAGQDFFTEPFQKIVELASEIKGNYHSWLRGGWSKNKLIWELVEEFARLDSFVNLNFIIYDSYSNFKKLFENVIDGIFASYAQSSGENDHFSRFDNFWIVKIIIYGDIKSIKRMATYYNITSLKYNAGNKNDEKLISLFRNLIDNQENLLIAKAQGLDKNNLQFTHIYGDLFENIFYISSLLEITSEDINEIGELLDKYIKFGAEIDYNGTTAVVDFIEAKGEILKTKIKNKILRNLISKHNFRTSDLIYPILSSYTNGKLTLSNNDTDSLMFQFYEECSICGHQHREVLFLTSSLGHPKHREGH